MAFDSDKKKKTAGLDNIPIIQNRDGMGFVSPDGDKINKPIPTFPWGNVGTGNIGGRVMQDAIDELTGNKGGGGEDGGGNGQVLPRQHAQVLPRQHAQVLPRQHAQTQTSQDEYDAKRRLAAKDLLDANVMTQISNTIARKNLSSDLASLGLNNSGRAGTTSAMLGNAMSAQMAQNQRAYNESIADIEAGKLEDEQKTLALEASNLTSNISRLTDQASKDEYLTRAGLVKDKNGNWVNGEKTNYTDAMLRGINDEYYISNKTGSGSSNEISSTNYDLIVKNLSAIPTSERDKYLQDKGLVKDSNGKWVNGEGSNYSDSQLAGINESYLLSRTGDQEAIGTAGAGGFSGNEDPADVLAKISITGGADATDGRYGIRNEVYEFYSDLASGNIKPVEGYMVKLQNGHSENCAYLIYQDGEWVQVDARVAEDKWNKTNAGNKSIYKGSDSSAVRYQQMVTSYEKYGLVLGSDGVWRNGTSKYSDEELKQLNAMWQGLLKTGQIKK